MVEPDSSQTPATTRPAMLHVIITLTVLSCTSPCSNVLSAAVGEKAATLAHAPPRVAATKSSAHEPTVTPSATIAALAACRVMAAAVAARPTVNAARNKWPSSRTANSAPCTCPPYDVQSATAAMPGMSATIHAAASASALTASIVRIDAGDCTSNVHAPVARSDEKSRMTTNGSRNVAAMSYAPNVGTRTPSSGFIPCASAAPPPATPLISAKVCTDVMNSWPTIAPTSTSRSTIAGDSASSLSSLRRSNRARATLREGKEHLFDTAARHAGLFSQLGQRALADRDSVGQQHEAVTEPRRIGELVNREA